MSHADMLRTARAAAEEAMAVHRAHFGRVGVERWTTKGVADFVSHVDHEAEAAVVARIRRDFPNHKIVAEEAEWEIAGTEAEPAGPEWIIDPLDGTTNYLHGYPMYAVSIGVVLKGQPIVGVVASAGLVETYWAVRGEGAFRNDVRITVSEIDALQHALIGTGFPFRAQELLPRYLREFERVLRRTAGIRRAGSAALDLCHVANGYFDGFWELALAPWDVAAGTLIVREAGGIVTRLNGEAGVIGHGAILAGNPAIHAALGRELRAVDAKRSEDRTT